MGRNSSPKDIIGEVYRRAWFSGDAHSNSTNAGGRTISELVSHHQKVVKCVEYESIGSGVDMIWYYNMDRFISRQYYQHTQPHKHHGEVEVSNAECDISAETWNKSTRPVPYWPQWQYASIWCRTFVRYGLFDKIVQFDGGAIFVRRPPWWNWRSIDQL